MKDLVRGFMKWLIIVLTTLTLITWVFIFMVYCQDAHPQHKSNDDFEETVAFRTVVFTSKDDRLLFYKKEYAKTVYLGSFGYDQYTKFYDFKLDTKMCVLYCRTHSFAYIVDSCEKK